MFIFDQSGLATPYWEQEPSFDDLKKICEKNHLPPLSPDEVYAIICAQVRQEEQSQLLRLAKLKRNIEV